MICWVTIEDHAFFLFSPFFFSFTTDCLALLPAHGCQQANLALRPQNRSRILVPHLLAMCLSVTLLERMWAVRAALKDRKLWLKLIIHFCVAPFLLIQMLVVWCWIKSIWYFYVLKTMQMSQNLEIWNWRIRHLTAKHFSISYYFQRAQNYILTLIIMIISLNFHQ